MWTLWLWRPILDEPAEMMERSIEERHSGRTRAWSIHLRSVVAGSEGRVCPLRGNVP
jgi:hypothetical protein